MKSEEEEIIGLDATEHGLPSAYAGFSIMDISNTMTMDVNENTSLGTEDYEEASKAKKDAAVPVINPLPETGISKVVIIAKLSKYDALKKAMPKIKIDGLTGSGMTWLESGEVNKDPKAVVIQNGEYVGM